MGDIRLSEKHGVNACIPICFWCGKEKGEIALLGKLPNDEAAPKYAILNYEPCDECAKGMAQGITFIGVSKDNPRNVPEIDNGLYPTGGMFVLKDDCEFLEYLLSFQSEESKKFILEKRKCLMDQQLLEEILSNQEEISEDESNNN